jgi:hypothetical protein
VIGVGYSQPPVRLANRGAVAACVLPACYVAVPYLVGVLAGRHFLRASDLTLLGGLYVGFIGRILLKDFRDVVGDSLFGKRTFLVRHGRRTTCVVSGVCWLAGSALMLAAVPHRTAALIAIYLALVAAALLLLAALATAEGARRDEALIAAIAIVGRGLLVILLGHLSMITAHWSPLVYDVTLVVLFILTTGQAWTMARHGPTALLSVPRVLRNSAQSQSVRGNGSGPGGIGRPSRRSNTAQNSSGISMARPTDRSITHSSTRARATTRSPAARTSSKR